MLDAQPHDNITGEVANRGYAILRNALRREDFEALKSTLSEAIDSDLAETRSIAGTVVARVMDVAMHAKTLGISDALERAAHQPALHAVARVVFGGRAPKLRNIYAIRSMPTEQRVRGLPYGWHFDRLGMVKGFLALDPITADNGATELAPDLRDACKRRRLAAIAQGTDPLTLTNALDLEGPQKIPLRADAGDMVILDTDVPHRAGSVRRGHHRFVLRIDLWCPDHPGLPASEATLQSMIWATVEDIGRTRIPEPSRDVGRPIADFGIDSLGLVNLLIALETCFGLTFSFDAIDARNFQSVATIEATLRAELGQ